MTRDLRAALLGVGFLLATTSANGAPSDGGLPPRPEPGSVDGGLPKSADPASGQAGDGAARTESDVAENPHGHGGIGHGGDDGFFRAPEDGAIEDPSLPVGTLEIRIADPAGNPLPNKPVTVGVLYNSVAKGESRKRLSVTTDASGIAKLEHLETGSTVAYRPMVIEDGATFSAMPFRMPDKSGMRALLHVYPVVEDVESALVVTQSMLYAEVKDDRIQIQQAFKIYNFGRAAWVPRDLVVSLPEGFTAFTSQQGMTDTGVDSVPNKGVRIHGTFGPGQHVLEFRWQLPYSGEPEVRFDVGMTPHMAASRVIAPASKDMILEVPGFPPPQSTTDGMGQRALVTEKQVRKDDASLSTLSVVIRGLPTEGPGRLVATLLAAGGILVGLVLGTQRPGNRDRRKDRARLLSEIAELERARRTGDVGPKTYEKARRELIDALARTFADEPAERVASGRRAPRARSD